MEKLTEPPSTEYERKFLVLLDNLPKEMPEPLRFVQGYLGIEPLQYRIRFVGDNEAKLEIKGPRKFESSPMPLPLDQARYLLDNYSVEGSSLIEKDWFSFPASFDGLLWEIHWFLGYNQGLVVAEIEYPEEYYVIPPDQIPEWIGPEITDDNRFKNKVLTFHPFKDWPEEEQQDTLSKMGL